jgi:hypothetical protein
MRFNTGFTPELFVEAGAHRRIPGVNHVGAPFTQNKRYPATPRPTGDVVNPNAAFVYQTDQVLILIHGVRAALAESRFKPNSHQTK